MTRLTAEDLERIRHHLNDRAFLYESPDAYEAGTEAVVDALQAVADDGFDRSDLADEHSGAVSVPGLVLELEDTRVTAR